MEKIKSEITENFLALALHFHQLLIDSMKAYRKVLRKGKKAKDSEEYKTESEKLSKDATDRYSDFETVYLALDEACKERNVETLDILDSERIKEFGEFFYTMAVWAPKSGCDKPNIALKNKIKPIFSAILKNLESTKS